MKKIISELCEISEKSYYVWKSKSHTKLIKILETYFNESSIQEFNQKGYISNEIYKKDLLYISFLSFNKYI